MHTNGEFRNSAAVINSSAWIHLCRAKEFWDIFLRDLDSCTLSLSIVSPSITNDATWRLSNQLKELQQRKVKVTVYTRPPEEQKNRYSYNLAWGRLQRLGIETRLVSKLHHKAAIIDDTIWWEGGLNILGSYDFQEQMRRYEGSAAHALLQELNLD
jgi:phosphatidylserine/phosphatidylglycerophosphate/cardiolipin synthase-like enzyme